MGEEPSPLASLNMKFLSAYAMCVLGGNDHPAVADVRKVLEAVGYEWQEEDSSKVEDLVEEMATENFYAKAEAGLEKVKSCAGAGGSSGAPAANNASADAPADAPAKKESSSEEDMGGPGMFDE